MTSTVSRSGIREDVAAFGDRLAGPAPARGKQLNRHGLPDRELGQGLLGRVQVHELRLGAAEPELARRCADVVVVGVGLGLGELERDEPGETGPALRLDHQVGHRGGDRVDDRGPHLAPVAVTADRDGADAEQRYQPVTSLSLPVATSKTKPRMSSLYGI